MANEKYKLCIELLTEEYKRTKRADEIFSEAAMRQLALVSLCFDVCIESFVSYAKENGHSPQKLTEMGILPINAGKIEIDHAIKAATFLPKADLRTLCDDNLREIRKAMTSFLESNCGVIIIVDGDVKSQKRFWEKVGASKDQSPHGIRDVNRLTVASSDYHILDSFEKRLAAQMKVEGRPYCAKEEWEYKAHGLLSKSNIIAIEGFPAEIHLNEPQQLLLGRVMTHLVYETMRLNARTPDEIENFHRHFSNLPTAVSMSIEQAKDYVPTKTYELLAGLNGELRLRMERVSDATIFKKSQALRDFNQAAHEVFFNHASPEWKEVYKKARLRYDQKMKPRRPAQESAAPIGAKRHIK